MSAGCATCIDARCANGCRLMRTASDTLPPFEERCDRHTVCHHDIECPKPRRDCTHPACTVCRGLEQAPGYVKETSDDAIRQLQSHCIVARNEAKRAGRLVAAGIWEAFRAVLPDITRGFDLCSYCGHSNHGTEACPNDRCHCHGTEEG